MASAVGFVDGDRSWRWGSRGKGEEWEEERKGKRCHERNDRTLWVYAIKNVNICRRLVIGCKYGGGRVRCRDQMGRGGSHSSFVSLFIGMRGARAAPKPTLRAERTRAPGSSLSSSALISSRNLSSHCVGDVSISNCVNPQKLDARFRCIARCYKLHPKANPYSN